MQIDFAGLAVGTKLGSQFPDRAPHRSSGPLHGTCSPSCWPPT
jgi:hypothetical protein